jgi:hypothetical protein
MAKYKQHFEKALEMFCTTYSPCQYRDKAGDATCVNSFAMHQKGHQNARGRIIGSGPYESNFTFETYYEDWIDYLRQDVETAQAALEKDRTLAEQDTPDEKLVLRLHSTQLADFFNLIGSAQNLRSHTACFSCFMEMPQHVLPCSHVLCTSCVKGYGVRVSKFDYAIQSCPLHPEQTAWKSPFIIKFKPDFAGVRLLSLDG